MNIKRINEELKRVLNEGGGAGVEFEFDKADITQDEDNIYKFYVDNLFIASYMNRKEIYEDAGVIQFDEDEIVTAIIDDMNGMTYEDKDRIEVVSIDLQSISNYMYGAGWTRCDLGNGFRSDDDDAELRVYYTVDGKDDEDDIVCGFSFTPSEETSLTYDSLDDYEDEE